MVEQGQAAHRGRQLARRLDEQLPQLQCGQCGYAGCLPYAQALVRGDAPVTLCKPGGHNTANALAQLLEIKLEDEVASPSTPQVASIDPDSCVGCYKCIEACPVDAIIGAHGLLHVVDQEYCTGCNLCVEPCPVDCISLQPTTATGVGQIVQLGSTDEQSKAAAAQLRKRYLAKKERPALRVATGKVEQNPQELARQAMNRVKRSSAASK